MKSLCILGRQPALGLAELETLYGADKVRFSSPSSALLDVDFNNINYQSLGGSIKVARILATRPTTNWPVLYKFLCDSILDHIDSLPAGTFNLGVSTYGLKIEVHQLNRDLLKLKKIIKAKHPVRIVPNKTNELNSAQVLHNKLTHKGGWELLFVRDGQQTHLAQTMFVQDIDAYAARDQARPKRDARVGMLPPKLAQIIINLAVGQIESPVASRQSPAPMLVTRDKRLETKGAPRLLDPFCGTGVILQEALLMGYEVYGTDLEPRMVEYSKANLEWLAQNFQVPNSNFQLETGDAITHKWNGRFDTVASEVYLGRPFTAPPSPEILKQNVSDVNVIIKKFLQNLASQTKTGFRACLAMPAWRQNNQTTHLPLLDKLTEMGYNRVALKHASFDELIYARPGQFVGRELVILERLRL